MNKEQLIKTKGYMDSLAMGINPITGESAADGDVIHEPEMIRAFYCVADVLREIISSGGNVSKVRGGKQPFEVSDDMLEHFEYSDEPIGITEVGRRINLLIDPSSVKQLKVTSLTAFMVKAGLLKEIAEGDSRRKTPTEAGFEAGLLEEKFRGRYGEYTKVLYPKDMQQFLIDNMLSIIELNNAN